MVTSLSKEIGLVGDGADCISFRNVLIWGTFQGARETSPASDNEFEVSEEKYQAST